MSKWIYPKPRPGYRRFPMVCLIDEAGSIQANDPYPFRVGFLLTCHPERLESDLKRLKSELTPRDKHGEYHASKDNPQTRAMIRGLLCLNTEPQMYIVEWDKAQFSPRYFLKGKLKVTRDGSPLMTAFAITAPQLAAYASASQYSMVDIIVEASKVDIHSEHRSRDQAFRSVLQVAMEKQAAIKQPPPGTRTVIKVTTARKPDYPILSYVDYWLWAYSRCIDRGETTLFPRELECRTTVRVMTEEDIRNAVPD